MSYFVTLSLFKCQYFAKKRHKNCEKQLFYDGIYFVIIFHKKNRINKMALLPIIYTSLLIVIGLFIIVFSVSYISFKYRNKKLSPVTINRQDARLLNKQVADNTVKILPVQNIESFSIPNKPVFQINENKKINVINHQSNAINNYKPKRQKRFSIISAAETQKFNQFTESIEITAFQPNETLSLKSFSGMDLLKFYDE